MMQWLSGSKQKVKYEGRYNFFPVVNTETIDSSSTISITCFTDQTLNAAIPCSYMWFYIKNSLPQEASQFRGSTFICDTTHIGYYIQAHIFSHQAQYGGKAILTFGPVQLDASLKTDVLNTLAQGHLTQSVYLLDSEQTEVECQLNLLESQIEIKHRFSNINYMFNYSIMEPEISIATKQINKINLLFNQKYQSDACAFQRKLFYREDTSHIAKRVSPQQSRRSIYLPKLQVKFLTRRERDSFLFAVRAFIARQQMKNWVIIRKIQNINFQKQEDFKAITQIQSLRQDLVCYDKIYKQTLIDKNCLQQQISEMQRHSKKEPLANLGQKPNANKFIQQIPQSDQIRDRTDKFSLMETNQLQNSIQSKSSFKKKSAADCESIANILDQFKDSQICHFDVEAQTRFKQIQKEKSQLEQKLEKSQRYIRSLQKRLKSEPNTPCSLIKFAYNTPPQLNPVKQLSNQNTLMKKHIQYLQQQNRRLQAQANSLASSQSPLQNIRSQSSVTHILLELKLLKSINQNLNKQILQLTSTMATKQRQISQCKKHNQQLLNAHAIIAQRCLEAEKNLSQIEQQMSVLRNNSKINRSQSFSNQMQNFNQQKMKILKQHNQLLANENDKLAQACQKYMTEARQTNKLRQEILQLKQKLIAHTSNPESSSYLYPAA